MSESWRATGAAWPLRFFCHSVSDDVTVEDLLILGDEKPPRRKATRNNGRRPAGKVREVFDRVSKLPRRQQEHIVNWVSAYVSHYEQNR